VNLFQEAESLNLLVEENMIFYREGKNVRIAMANDVCYGSLEILIHFGTQTGNLPRSVADCDVTQLLGALTNWP
jgi:hypothetical protein